jgi:fructose-bisphosphate aldolase class II
MGLRTNTDLMVPARAGGYAVGAFNTSNLEISRAIFEAAKELRSPVIVATSHSAIEYAGYANLHSIVANLSESTGVPASLHLDHGTDLDVVKACLEHGWTSIMYDGSHLEFEENIKITKQVVEMCAPRGVPVEAELGRLMGVEDEISVAEHEAVYTDPDQAAEFVERTGCSTLAIAIGTSHGAYKFKGEPKLAIDRLEKIAALIKIPLVLHGASAVPPDVLELAVKYGAKLPGARGVPPQSIREAVGRGIAKVNIDTDLRLAFTGRVRQFLAESPDVFDPRKILNAAIEGMRDLVKSKIELFGSGGKA